MDNASRSQRTRKAVIQAALAIIARDGPGRLTLDAIARESGVSKGGLMHQFRTKEAVLKALLEHQIEYFADFSRAYMAEHGAGQAEPHLAAQIATLRETLVEPHSVAFAIFGAVAQEPSLLSITRESDGVALEAIKAEAKDQDLALLRWAAARGLAVSALLGLCPLGEDERERLFDRLLDEGRWAALTEKSGGSPASSTSSD
ncbi:TetR family transcriptional regulator [Methylosinus sp. H3A]|uniref:TetR/AcrR family transcriptional regulator n=1 Tax=Methylosinus sp. H3A TaxID=2785786 RepID=UPI0018C31654|nr:TetR/AcrR family transcriptional regulator [Methylosinus sp. H3A]MBG0812150.1 TetR family transcriptional regulator [Methylosinus sp. H3A]